MAKFVLNLFTPETWEAFRENGSKVSGFKHRQRRLASERVGPGTIFLCYLTKLSRWSGALRATSEAYEDATPIYGDPDPFVIRFKVEPLVELEPEKAVPIFEPEVWRSFSETRDFEIGSAGWTGFFRASLREVKSEDGDMLMSVLRRQAEEQREYSFSTRDLRQMARKGKVRTVDREVSVEVPDDSPEEEPELDVGVRPAVPQETAPEARESIKVQAQLADMGAKMGFRVWVPRNDRARVLEHVAENSRNAFLAELPLNYDDTTLRTIENIDVIWLKGRSMTRAFEVEHTTAIYSGLLRMADLLALQPNMNIKLHIVAPDDKRDKVLREIKRPVFSLLDRGPLYESCTFIPYPSVEKLATAPFLAHMSDSIIEEYEEAADD